MVNEEASVTWVRNFDTETESPIEGQTTGSNFISLYTTYIHCHYHCQDIINLSNRLIIYMYEFSIVI